MSRRNTYLLGGLTVVAGIAHAGLRDLALTSDGDDSTSGSERDARSGPSRRRHPPRPPAVTSAARASPPAQRPRGAAIRRDLARRRPVRAPDFSAEVIQEGSMPQALRAVRPRRREGPLEMSKLRGHPGRAPPVVLAVRALPRRHAPGRGDLEAMGPARRAVRRREREGVRRRGRRAVAPPVRPHLSGGLRDRSGQIAERYGVAAPAPDVLHLGRRGHRGRGRGQPFRPPARARRRRRASPGSRSGASREPAGSPLP